MRSVVVAIMVVLVLMVEPGEGQGINCNQVESSLFPCLGYLTGGGSPSSGCCSAVSTLHLLSKAEKRIICECLKAAIGHQSGIREDLASSLPKNCGVDVGMTITKDVKCIFLKLKACIAGN